MASLHSSLKALSPVAFSEVPTEKADLKPWLIDIFSRAQLIIDSIPIPAPSDVPAAPTAPASKASEIVPSAVRPPLPAEDSLKLQKEWGKPVKLGAKENAMGMSVYKLSGKDGKGAWFARRSVHEGLSFSKFKKALQMEFPESLQVQGAPGEGNVRGIGGETKVEDVKVDSTGRVEVYRLSAQFPGPTTPRDFVTLLLTSDNALEESREGEPPLRHYMIVSKPCDHPNIQPQSGFIRGFYESVEFIREVPKQLKGSQSMSHLPQSQSDSVSREAMIRNAEQKTRSSTTLDDTRTLDESSEASRKRSATVPSRPSEAEQFDDSNPVEWIMVTRSDPGGSVPRFMVERGTPGSICADAEKFLDWACQQDFDDDQIATAAEPTGAAIAERRDSFQSFRSSRMAGVNEKRVSYEESALERLPENEREMGNSQAESTQQNQTGILGAVTGAAQYLSTYTPQIVLDHLPGSNNASPEHSKTHLTPPEQDDDTTSVASFESADSHLTTSGSEGASLASSKVAVPRTSEEHLTSHEKELKKLEQRRTALERKFTESRTKLEHETSAQTAKEEQAQQKAAEKHERELRKQKEKYEKELKKLEDKKEKERKKLEAKKRKEAEKDERVKLARERDEAREELILAKQEAAMLRTVVEDLQRQNTAMAAKLGRAGLAAELSSDENISSSRHSSPRRTRASTYTASDSASSTMKSH